MKYNTLGRTDIKVSELCLGTMTWGTQNTEADGHEQMSVAHDHGINFFDTAEMYPTTPLSAEKQGLTEEIVGSWFKATGNRDEIILATKITGAGPKWMRDGAGISPDTIRIAVEGSLKRLQTDVIDLYQLHWPNRGSYHFRQNWTYQPARQDRGEMADHASEVLKTLNDLIAEGKIRHVGLSNESCWGTSQFLRAAETQDLPRVVSIQNEYNLMCRLFDLDLAELSHHEDVGLLAYSPLAAGLLSGKYHDGQVPDGSRRSINKDLGGRYALPVDHVVDAYNLIAKSHALDPCQMAIAFCLTRPFMTSVIIGATTMEQLHTNIGARDVQLSDQVLEEIQAVYRQYPIPF